MQYRKTYLFILLVILCTACQEDWLEIKRDKGLIVPTTLKDMRMLLNNESLLAKDYIGLTELSADDYVTTSDFYNSRSLLERNAYLWKEDIFEGQEGIADWDDAYAQVLVANVVLEGLSDISPDDASREEWDDVKGGALHLRARAFYNLAQTFAKPYDPTIASTTLGIPLRLTSDINVSTVRASLEETYSRIIGDLKEAASLLRSTPEFIADPSQASAYGLLARCYLSMRNYEMAFAYADKCIQQHSALIDFNDLDPSVNFPVPRYNDEVIQHIEVNPLYGFFTPFYSRIDDQVYQSYDNSDLRKAIYFRDMGNGEYAFKGNFSGGYRLFSGITTGEMYLIRAECSARLGEVEAGIDDLNTLLEFRFVTGTYTRYETGNPTVALDIILAERRKELLRRGLKWSDLRRLNFDPNYATTIVRTIDGVDYTLSPGDPRYVLPVPDYIITASGIQQNLR